MDLSHVLKKPCHTRARRVPSPIPSPRSKPRFWQEQEVPVGESFSIDAFPNQYASPLSEHIMPYTPYFLQTLLPPLEESSSAAVSTHTSQSSPFFSRRTTSLQNDAQPSPLPTSSSVLSTFSGTSNPPSSPSIVCVEAWEQFLYLGTSDGQVIYYTLDEHVGKTASVELSYVARRESARSLRVGRKPVERILVLPQVSTVAVLCGSILSFYSLPSFEQTLIDPIKDVSAFAHDTAEEDRIGEDGTIELCIVRRRPTKSSGYSQRSVIQIYKIGEHAEMTSEIPIPTDAIMLARCRDNICLTSGEQYTLINLRQSIVSPLADWQPPTQSRNVGPHNRPCPIAAVVREGEFLVAMASENNQSIGVFIDGMGNPTRSTLLWSSYPKALCVEYPYIVTLLHNNVIEIHSISDQSRLQVIRSHYEASGMSLVKGITVHIRGLAEKLRRRIWPRLTDGDVSGSQDLRDENELQRKVARYSTMPARILVFGRNSVMAQLMMPLVTQVDVLLAKNQVEEALKMTDEARETMAFDNAGYVMRLRSEMDYIYQKCGFLLLKETLFEDAFSRLSMGDIDPRVVIQLFRELSMKKYTRGEPRVLLFEDVRTLVDGMGSIEDIVAANIEKIYDKPSEEEQQRRSPQMELRGILLKNAREEVEKYLRKERSKREEKIGKGTIACKAIDVAILRLLIDREDLYQFLKGTNDCYPDDCKDILIKAKRYYALSLLYKSKHMYEKLLDLWTRIYTGELSDPAFQDGLNCIKRLLLDDPAAADIPAQKIAHYTWWLVAQSPADGVELLIRAPHVTGMDPDDILAKLEEHGNEAVRTFLEYLVLTCNSESAEHHTRLACSYVVDVQKELEANPSVHASDTVEEFKWHVSTRRMGTNQDGDSTPFVNYLAEQKAHIPLVKRRLSLLRLLQRSPIYSAETLLETVSKAGPLTAEKTIILGRLGRHEEALGILINELGDYAGAETYCITNGRSIGTLSEERSAEPQQAPPTRTSSLPQKYAVEPIRQTETTEEEEQLTHEDMAERKKLCTLLLKIYLKREQDGRQGSSRSKSSDFIRARSLHLVNTQGCYLDPLEVLQMIPDDWPVQSLQDFLVRSLGRTLYDHRESTVELSMWRGESLLVESELRAKYEALGPLRIDQHSRCAHCWQMLTSDCVVQDMGANRQSMHVDCAKTLGVIKDTINS